jgi:mannose-6-phosphate isomerase-like protein (cupin superfamily)
VRFVCPQMFVVPKSVEHKPYPEHEVKLLLIEPRGVLNTGDQGVNAQHRMMFGFDEWVDAS